jgi:hypothetical protein
LGIKPLKEYFTPSSNVMYGSSNSLIITSPTSVNSSTLNSFAFSGVNGENRSRDTTWANIVDWNGYKGTQTNDVINTDRGGGAESILNRTNKFFDGDEKTSISGGTGGKI